MTDPRRSAERKLVHPRDEIMQTMERIYRFRMTTTSGGNLSIRDEHGDVWITPARIDKGRLTRNDIVCVHPDGTTTGPHPPSSEYPFHKAVYDARPDLYGIVHAHPVALVAFSMVHEVPDTRLFHQARHVCGEVGFAAYALPGSDALAASVAGAFKNDHTAVVLENHGVVVGGTTLQEAFQRFETLEFTAKTIIKARVLGEVRYLDDSQLKLPGQALPLPELAPAAATSREQELRRELCEFVRRGYQQRLLISTEGSFSVRLDEQSFLITPYRMDRNTLELDDLVFVERGSCEEAKKPSRAARPHQAIYDGQPNVHAIVNAYPVNATAFSVTSEALDSRTIPESYLFLRDVGRVPYGPQFTDPAGLADHVSSEAPVALLENDGVLVTGSSILDAFDRLEVLESTAEALINSRILGEVSPMSGMVIAELRQAFLKD